MREITQSQTLGSGKRTVGWKRSLRQKVPTLRCTIPTLAPHLCVHSAASVLVAGPTSSGDALRHINFARKAATKTISAICSTAIETPNRRYVSVCVKITVWTVVVALVPELRDLKRAMVAEVVATATRRCNPVMYTV